MGGFHGFGQEGIVGIGVGFGGEILSGVDVILHLLNLGRERLCIGLTGRPDPELEEYLHLYLMNRGVLITPFHNMALMCPVTTEEQVDRHTEVFGAAVAELAA